MNLKFPSGATPPEFGGPLNPSKSKNPEKTVEKMPLPPLESELKPRDLQDAQVFPHKELPQTKVHLCAWHPEPDEGKHPPKMHQCAFYPDQDPKGEKHPPKMYQCAYFPDQEEERHLQPKHEHKHMDQENHFPDQPPGIYQCSAKIEPGKLPGSGIYQCSAKIEPDKGFPNSIYQCTAKLDD
ncbi:hypothetical protein COW36_07975 [bacterium (Candidatus Blackallbacteria) CG17_big_fil_post_rev_8_21_14_2_50_48_46]|uniref:Uncharacterized protein n=1 Tax=bacterium (Candidatus Blackallbacteria) CG17_big_fil_post_rev_8_21_14_2_50_48_46 TaxID=2014261 RepID=A0A2M7G6S8_9BACT|nr:MAG: hypothetical protein COW64_23040 [bacterium (Candidatus Blackallbacteria) CG18_big_fil_WC_8_21_14_2_50_49_26]PIW17672.1 MAG: hypothetical protein COW36_07975 [bacterium (Candidatus Blackallbacteria) CG17_big_fil_post_rev_8_21_14_2_50_48_46]PIW50109.1 MAG: hypothetical protein COW20_03635 [bacterium (Candidatus Blackallbacteria) CG13_big_fil_rev_8_21_14_2_50_49_14]